MPRSPHCRAGFGEDMLAKDRIRIASRGDPTLLVMTVPGVVSSVGDDVDVFCMPIEVREGGMLLLCLMIAFPLRPSI